MEIALVFSQPAALRFQAGIDIPDNWSSLHDFGVIGNDITSVRLGNAIFVFRNDEVTVEPSIVIQLSADKLFSTFSEGTSRLEALKRAIDAGVLVLGGGGALPSYWRPFAGGKFMTFQALPISKGDARRLALWRRLPPAENPCVYIFDLTEKQSDFKALNPDLQLLETVLAYRGQALTRLPIRRVEHVEVGTAALTLDDLRPSEQVDAVISGWKLEYLYQKSIN